MQSRVKWERGEDQADDVDDEERISEQQHVRRLEKEMCGQLRLAQPVAVENSRRDAEDGGGSCMSAQSPALPPPLTTTSPRSQSRQKRYCPHSVAVFAASSAASLSRSYDDAAAASAVAARGTPSGG